MATDTQSTTPSTKLRPYRLSVGQYLKMIDAGVFPPNARVELLGGILVPQMTKGNPHDGSLWMLGEEVRRLIPPEWIVREEKSLELGPRSRAEPDLAVVLAPGSQYFARTPQARETALVVEVADSTYSHDRGVKYRLYAAAKIPVDWIVNLNKRQVEVYRQPTGTGTKATYGSTEIFGIDDAVPVIIEGREVGRLNVADLLPRSQGGET